MAQSAVSVANKVGRFVEERSLLKQRFYQAWQHRRNFVERDRNDALECEAVLAMPRRCVDALWSYLDGVYESQVAPGVAG